MQKAVRRVERARRQAQRKLGKNDAAEEFRKLWEAKNADLERHTELRVARRRERQRRREDWAAGPLSPWRQNMQNMLDAGFGTYSRQAAQNWSYANPADRAEDKTKTKGGRLLANEGRLLVAGDRVCVVRGDPHVRGQIGTIELYSPEEHVYTIAGIGKMDARNSLNTTAFAQPGKENEIIGAQRRFKQADLRLVYPLPDPADPAAPPRDTILENVVARNFRFHQFDNETQFDRVVMPQGIHIPWPARKQRDHPTYAADTPRIDSEAVSFLPRLLSPPMPASVIDELRNRHSKTRIRFSDAFIARKTAEDEAAAHEAERARALVPQGARNIARLGRGATTRDGQPRPPPEFSDELAAAIGAYMDSSRAARGRPPS